jgi:mandelate racemase
MAATIEKTLVPASRAAAGVTIRKVTAKAQRVPMAEPHRTASGVVAEATVVRIDLETSEGVAGRSIVFSYTPPALEPLAQLVTNVGALAEGKPLDPASLWRALQSRFRLLGTHGMVGMAIAGIDMAAWDALARIHGLPLCRLLGATPRPIPAYGGVGYDGVAGSAHAAEAWAKRGFRGVKAKIGYPSVEEDIAVARAMREAVGPGVALMVDYNQSLGVTEAIERARRLDDAGIGLDWIEEPVQAEDYAGMARVARESRIPIQAGENWWTPLEFAKAIEARATDCLMPDAMKCGGVTPWMEIAAMARVAGLPVSSHLFPEVSAQLLAATPTAQWLEYTDWWNPIVERPLEIRDGQAIPSEAPGSGLDWKA